MSIREKKRVKKRYKEFLENSKEFVAKKGEKMQFILDILPNLMYIFILVRYFI